MFQNYNIDKNKLIPGTLILKSKYHYGFNKRQIPYYLFKPINKEHISVSVIADNAMKADALATALNVMGLEKGLDFSNKNKIKVLYIVKENEEFILKTSKWF